MGLCPGGIRALLVGLLLPLAGVDAKNRPVAAVVTGPKTDAPHRLTRSRPRLPVGKAKPITAPASDQDPHQVFGPLGKPLRACGEDPPSPPPRLPLFLSAGAFVGVATTTRAALSMSRSHQLLTASLLLVVAGSALWGAAALASGAPGESVATVAAAGTTLSPIQVLQLAATKALGGGRAGAAAAAIQVLSLMWLRTAMNYQYRYGGGLRATLSQLWKEGGVPRLYQGLPFALLQGPLARFGDTAASVGVLAVFAAAPLPFALPLAAQTAVASGVAGAWRIFLMPIDTFKTAVQVNGPEGLRVLQSRIAEEGAGVLYNGSLAAAGATIAGHYPWFFTYSLMVGWLPEPAVWAHALALDPLAAELLRSAAIGFVASTVSDCVSNALRVLKTTKQTVAEPLTYVEVLQLVLRTDGVPGLLGRGLGTRLLCNGIQGTLFTVVWRYLQARWV